MAERDDQGFEVVPTRIGGTGGPSRSGGRRRGPIVLVLVLAVLIPTVAFIGPRIEWRPEVDLSFLRPTPTPVPSNTPRATIAPTTPPATPLPSFTLGQGPIPSEPFAVDVGGLRLADPATGTLGQPTGLRGDTDVIFTAGDGDGWWCLCLARTQVGPQETVVAEIRRVDRSGTERQRQRIGEYRSSALNESLDFSVRLDLEVSPDERTAYLSTATRSGDAWTVVLEAIDLRSLEVVGRNDLGKVVIPVPDPTPNPEQGPLENYIAGPFMRLSPDGRRLLLWSWVETYTQNGPMQPPSTPQAWLIDVGPGEGKASIGRPTAIGPAFSMRLRTCYWTAWMNEEELAAICWPSDGSGSLMKLILLTPDGTELRSIDFFDSGASWLAEPLLDRANRFVYAWLPNDHTIKRIDLDTLHVDELTVDPGATVTGPSGTGAGEPRSGAAPEWTTFTSDLRMWYSPQLVAEPGGSRLFALGILNQDGRGNTPGSSGIWVFDASDLSLLDRWGAVAAYSSIGFSGDARWLIAIGAPGADADGKVADWQSSITVHDLSDGRPALQFGSLGTDVQVIQVPPAP
jgi:hypothetical protein